MKLIVLLSVIVSSLVSIGATVAVITLAAPAYASVQDCQSWPSIGGTWYREGDHSSPASISQVNNRLVLTNEFGSVANGELVDDTTFTVTQAVSDGRNGNRWAAGLTATLRDWDGANYATIDWGNGSTWRR